MKKKLLVGMLAAMLSLSLTACAPNISPDVVSASDSNDVQTAVEGVIVSKRIVTVKGDSNMLGTLAGAGLGALAGSAVGGGNMRYATGLAGGLAGGAAGNAIEDKLTTQQGIEYVIRLAQQDSGTTTVTTTGQGSASTNIRNRIATAKAQNSSTTTIGSKSSANRYVTVVQGQGQQVLQVGQKVLVAGTDGGHARIISTL